MSDNNMLAVEELLAAAIMDAPDEVLFISRKSLETSLAGKVIAIDFDEKKNGLALTIVEQEEVDYDDEE